MCYIVVRAKILNDGSIKEGRHRQAKVWPVELNVGGLYFLSHGVPGSGKLYRVIEKVSD